MDNLRALIEHFLKDYDQKNDVDGIGIKQYVEKEAPKIIEATGLTSEYFIKGSAGAGNYSLNPWVAVMSKRITNSVKEGFYIVYIKSRDPNCVYLTLNQGCTQLKNTFGNKKAKEILLKRNEKILNYITNDYGFTRGMFEFNEWGPNSELYPYASILYATYNLDNLPSNEKMIEDLSKMLTVYSETIEKYDEIKDAILEEYEKPMEPTVSFNEDANFVKMLKDNGLCYSPRIIELFLLSLKAKQFVILSGGSGTGKTKLAQTYGQYLDSTFGSLTDAKKITVKLGESDKNGGYTLGKKLYGDDNPITRSKEYPIKIGNLDTSAEIELTPRLWFRKNKAIISKEIKRLKDEGNEYTEISIFDSSFQNGQHYELVPVGSNWTESRFIIGYYNVLKNEYKDTQSSKLIKRSNIFSDEPFFLILDEMNLSHVERYFSDVLSAMESGVPISLDVPDSSENLLIGDNLFIVGTVNIDETTYSFSPKVLDRANVIEFESMGVSDYINFKESDYLFKGDTDYLFDCKSGLEVRKMKSKDIVDRLSKIDSNAVQIMISDLEKIREILDKINLSFGFRTIDEIMRFMYVSYEYMGFKKFDTWNVYFDAQIKQKILPKIHGNMSILEALQDIQKVCRGNESDENVVYSSSYDKLKHMIEVLKNQRYVTFNS